MITAERNLTKRDSRYPVTIGVLAGVATFAFLMIGAQRAFDLDDSITVGLFVRTPSITDAFTTPYVLNNQVGLSFIEHVVYSVTGAHSELAMRFLPIVFASGAVGALAGLLAPSEPAPQDSRIVVTTGANMGASSAGRVSRPARAALRQANRCCGVMSCRRATSDATAPGA